MNFYLTHLYPEEMCIYGDMGNIIVLTKRLQKLGWNVVYQKVGLNHKLPKQTDFYFIGGGQDKEQFLIFQDLFEKKDKLIQDIENNVPILAICGGYQLLGKHFVTSAGENIPGIDLLPVTTQAPDDSVKSRCIGNIIVECTLPDMKKIQLLGFENHSGQTYFDIQSSKNFRPLGKVLVGYGNNSIQKVEGCVYKNAIGTYLHGPCLAKNPELSNYLIIKAVDSKSIRERAKTPTLNFNKINDTIAKKAKDNMIEKLIGKE